MRARLVGGMVHPGEGISRVLILALCQVAMGAFAGSAAYFGRDQLGLLHALGIVIGGALLAVSALRAFDPSPPLWWYLQSGGGRFAWIRKLTAPPALALAFVSFAPISVAAIVDRYSPHVPLGTLAAVTLLGTFTLIAAVRLRQIMHGRVAARIEEWEGAFALGAVSLGAILFVAWVIARFDQVLAPGPFPGPLSIESAVLLPYAGTLAAGLAVAFVLFLPRLAGNPPVRVVRITMAVLCVPLVAVLLMPMQPSTGPGMGSLGYAEMLSSRAFVATIVTVGLVHFIAPRTMASGARDC